MRMCVCMPSLRRLQKVRERSLGRVQAPPPRPAAPLVRTRKLRPLPVPSAPARMAAGTRPAAAPRSRAAMAQWRKKKGLRKRRGAASQSRSSDSEDGEFEIQAEDDARAQKVVALGLDIRQSPSPGSAQRPAASVFPAGEWSRLRVGRGRLAGGRGRTSGLSTCFGVRHAQGPDVPSLCATEAGACGPSGLPGRLLVSRFSLATSWPGAGPGSHSSNEKCG